MSQVSLKFSIVEQIYKIYASFLIHSYIMSSTTVEAETDYHLINGEQMHSLKNLHQIYCCTQQDGLVLINKEYMHHSLILVFQGTNP